PLGRREEDEREGHCLVLRIGSVGGQVAHLRQRVVETDLLGGAGDLAVVLRCVVGALVDPGDDQAAGDVGHPVGEGQRVAAGRAQVTGGEVGGGGLGHGQAPFGVVVALEEVVLEEVVTCSGV